MGRIEKVLKSSHTTGAGWAIVAAAAALIGARQGSDSYTDEKVQQAIDPHTTKVGMLEGWVQKYHNTQNKTAAGFLAQLKETEGRVVSLEDSNKDLGNRNKALVNENVTAKGQIRSLEQEIQIQQAKDARTAALEESKKATLAMAPFATSAVRGTFSGGTGFSIPPVTDKNDNLQYLHISCKHVVDDMHLVHAVTGEEKTVSGALTPDGHFGLTPYSGTDFVTKKETLAKTVFRDPEFDIAAFNIEGKKDFPVLPLRNLVRHPIRVNEDAYLVWNGPGYAGTVTKVGITHTGRCFAADAYNIYAIELTGTVPGHSGGPVITLREEDGKYVAEVAAIVYSADKKGGTWRGWALPALECKRSLENHGYNILEADEKKFFFNKGMARVHDYTLPTPAFSSPLTAILPAFANQYPYEVLGVRERPLADPVPSYRQIEFNSAKLRSKLRDSEITKK